MPFAFAYPLRMLTKLPWMPFRYTLPRRLFPPHRLPRKHFRTNFFGLTYEGRLDNEIDWSVFFFGCYVCHELACLSHLSQFLRESRPELSFYDVGANVGNHSLFMAKHVDNVLSFEPFKLVGNVLAHHIQINTLTNIQWHEVALGNAEAKQLYHVPSEENLGMGSLIRDNDMDSGEAHHVQEVVGDEYLARHHLPRIDIMKIDVEGYERRVLEGLGNTIRKDRPAIMMELKDVGQSELQNEETLRALVYDSCTIYGLRKSKTGGFQLTAFSFEKSDEVLILPKEHQLFVAAHL